MFKIGDIITGVSGEYCGITTDGAMMRVKGLGKGDHILVELVSHKIEEYQRHIGRSYLVKPELFVRVKPKFKGNN